MTPRWPTVALLGALVASIGFVIFNAQLPEPEPAVAPSASIAPAAAEKPDGGLAVDAGAPAPQPEDELKLIAAGKVAPPLPASAPKKVRFGAILLTYKGAEQVLGMERTKAQARERAASLIDQAKSDFAEAAKRGDAGSTADAGEIPQGILEPHLEYLLFTLKPKTVFREPIDTPRGFLIVKRL